MSISQTTARAVIRDADESAVDSIVAVHQQAFPGFFLTLLGPEFLQLYYRSVLLHPTHILLVAETESGVSGFVAGFASRAGFYSLLKAQQLSIVRAIFVRILSRPSILFRLFANYQLMLRRSATPAESGVVELSSIGTLPSLRGTGTGKALVRSFARNAFSRFGATEIVLTTDADNNTAVNSFYRGLGFTLARTYEVRRRRLNEYRFVTTATQ